MVYACDPNAWEAQARRITLSSRPTLISQSISDQPELHTETVSNEKLTIELSWLGRWLVHRHLNSDPPPPASI